jgi:nucleoside-diphosphate-sugar epimerase
MEGLTLFITGSAGYIGTMLADQFSKRSDVREIICLDKEAEPEIFLTNPKITWISANTSDSTWQEKVRVKNPDIVIHSAWQIREMYGNREKQWKWNIEGSQAVFDFSFTTPSVKKLVYFSTVASYGAFPQNSIEHFFNESEPFRKTDYLYAEEKRIVEENLRESYKNAKAKGKTNLQIFIIRPASITGPRGRYGHIRFGLQSALSGSIRGQKSSLYNFISILLSWVPATSKWLRQYVHEDDITDMVELFSFKNLKGEYEVFNAAPPGLPVLGPEMAKMVGKKKILVYPWMIRIVFFLAWHLTFGRIPTSKGVWKGYSYPIAVDGSKITKQYGFKYKYGSREAFTETSGRYESDALKR